MCLRKNNKELHHMELMERLQKFQKPLAKNYEKFFTNQRS